MFDELTKSSCKDLLNNVNQAKINWIKEPGKIDCPQIMIDLTNLYTNYTSTGHWTKDDDDSEANIITLATALHRERTKNYNRPMKSTTTGVQPILQPCKFAQDKKLKTIDGVKYMFCKDHGLKDDN